MKYETGWRGRLLAADPPPLAIGTNTNVKNTTALGDRANNDQHIDRSIEITFPNASNKFRARSKTTRMRTPCIDSASETQDYA